MAIDRYSPNEVGPPVASTAITYLVWFFLGNIGGHRFLTGRVGTGFIHAPEPFLAPTPGTASASRRSACIFFRA